MWIACFVKQACFVNKLCMFCLNNLLFFCQRDIVFSWKQKLKYSCTTMLNTWTTVYLWCTWLLAEHGWSTSSQLAALRRDMSLLICYFLQNLFREGPENEVYTREAFLSFQMYHITKCTQGRHVCPFKCTIYQSVHKGGIFVLPNVPHQSYKTSSPSLAVWTWERGAPGIFEQFRSTLLHPRI